MRWYYVSSELPWSVKAYYKMSVLERYSPISPNIVIVITDIRYSCMIYNRKVVIHVTVNGNST
jgi:hypothetical protein